VTYLEHDDTANSEQHGHLEYLVDGSTTPVEKYDLTPIDFGGLSTGLHLVRMHLVNNDGTENPYKLWQEMGRWMTDNCTVVRHNERLEKTIEQHAEWKQRYKKIKLYTNDHVRPGDLQMPENDMHTTAYWLTVPREVMATLPFSHEERRDGVVALSYTLGQMAALFLMCDRHDLGVALGDNGQGEAEVTRGPRRLTAMARAEAPAVLDYEPNIFIYDNYPGGIGLSEPLYRLHDRLLAESLSLIAACGCRDGCPSCVGPAGEVGSRGKEVALALLQAVRP